MELGNINRNEESSVGRWVDDRLGSLSPNSKWEPDVQRGIALLRLHRRDPRSSRKWVWVTAVSLAAGISLMATPVTRAFAQRCLSACESEPIMIRQLLAMGGSNGGPSAVYVRPESRSMAPDFTLNDLSGVPVKLSDFRGKVVLLNFWATWCAPCKAEVPAFVSFERAYGNHDFTVLGISLDEGGSSAVKQFVEAEHVNYPVLIGDNRIADAFGGLTAVPTTLIIDQRGRIAAVHIGLCKPSEYEADIKAVLGE